MSSHWENETSETDKPKRGKHCVRRVRDTDMDYLIAMDAAYSQEPWSRNDWKRETGAFGVGLLVASQTRRIGSPTMGFIMFRMCDEEMSLRRLVVDGLFQRTGIGSSLIEHFEESAAAASFAKKRIGESPLKKLTCCAPEYATALHCTLRESGYRCTEIINTVNDSPGFYMFEKPMITKEDES